MLMSEVDPTDDALIYVARHMRPIDRKEVWLSSASTPIGALRKGRSCSDICKVILTDGVPTAVYGLSLPTLLGGRGVPWMLGTDDIFKYPKKTVEVGLAMVEEFSKLSPMLANFVYAGNTRSIRWLKRIGFTIHEPQPHGEFKVMFHRFSRG